MFLKNDLELCYIWAQLLKLEALRQAVSVAGSDLLWHLSKGLSNMAAHPRWTASMRHQLRICNSVQAFGVGLIHKQIDIDLRLIVWGISILVRFRASDIWLCHIESENYALVWGWLKSLQLLPCSLWKHRLGQFEVPVVAAVDTPVDALFFKRQRLALFRRL